MRIPIAILLGGLAAGVLDILFAFAFYGWTFGATPQGILHSVAAGALSRDVARAGGWSTASLGLLFHMLIAIGMAAVYVLAATRLRFLVNQAWLWGALYGVALYFAMNYVIVPLSAAGANMHFASSIVEASERIGAELAQNKLANPLQFFGALFTHIVFVGLPISLIAKHYLRQHA